MPVLTYRWNDSDVLLITQCIPIYSPDPILHLKTPATRACQESAVTPLCPQDAR